VTTKITNDMNGSADFCIRMKMQYINTFIWKGAENKRLKIILNSEKKGKRMGKDVKRDRVNLPKLTSKHQCVALPCRVTVLMTVYHF
jgi:hypothetical protein